MTSEREPIDVDRLLEAVRLEDEKGVLEMFRGRAEHERRAVAAGVFKANFYQQDRSYYGACFACGTLTEIKKLDLAHTYGLMCNDVTYEVLLDRRPQWVTAWAQWAMNRQSRPSGRAEGMWTLVRKLIRAGICEPLDTDDYILGMIFADPSHYNYPSDADPEACTRHREGLQNQTMTDWLFEDPTLLEHEIWRIFEVPGRPSRQLGHTKPVQDRWNHTLVLLSRQGHIDRDRLLTATLDGLARDITAYQANWFIGLWWMLNPTAVERERHQPALLHLLAHGVPAIVGFCLGEIERSSDHWVLATATFLDEVEPVLLTMPVATVKRSLKLLDRIVEADAGARTSAMATAAAALLHTNKAVRAAAVTFLTRQAQCPDAELARILRGHLDGLTEDQVERLRTRGAEAQLT